MGRPSRIRRALWALALSALVAGGACGSKGDREALVWTPPPTTAADWSWEYPTTLDTEPAPEAPEATPPAPAPAPAAPAGGELPAEGRASRGSASRAPATRSGAPPVTGRIEIPKIGLAHTTYRGNTLREINYGPSHWPGTPMPGEPGNTVFPGHRTTYTRPYYDIDLLELGDHVVFTTAAGRFVYEVTEKLIVRPSEVWIVHPTPGYTFTIFGCHPKGSARYRYVVRGRLVSAPATPPSSAPPPQAGGHPPPRQPPPPTTTTTRPKRNCIVCL